MCSTFPYLRQRGVGESKHHYEISNFSFPSALVKMSTTFSFMEQFLKWIILDYTWYQIKWYFVLIYLVWSWNLGFLANLIAKVLLTKRGVEFSCFSYKSSGIFLKHKIYFFSSNASTYSTSIMEYVGIHYLHYLQEIGIDPRLIR